MHVGMVFIPCMGECFLYAVVLCMEVFGGSFGSALN